MQTQRVGNDRPQLLLKTIDSSSLKLLEWLHQHGDKGIGNGRKSVIIRDALRHRLFVALP